MFANAVSVLALLSSIAAVDVSLYEHVNQLGFIWKASNVTNCTELPLGHQQADSVDIHGGCISLYSSRNCSGGQMMTTWPGASINNDLSAWNFSNKVQSVSQCDPNRNTSVYLGTYNYGSVEVVHVTDPVENMPSCVNLPNLNKEITFALTYGVCLQLFSDTDCKGNSSKLKPGDAVEFVLVPIKNPNLMQYWVHIVHNMEGTSVVSVGPCRTPTTGCANCTQVSTTATVVGFTFPEDLITLLNPNKTKKVDILTRSQIINNSSGTLTETIRLTKSIAEEYQVSHFPTSTKIKKWSVSSTASPESSESLLGRLSSKISSKLTGEPELRASETASDSENNSTKSKKVYTIDKTVSINPCSYVEVGSFVTYVENMLVLYQITIQFQGTTEDREMTTAELSTSLPFTIEAERAIDNRTIEGRVNGSIRASMGIDMFFFANERKLDGCVGPQGFTRSQAPNPIASPKLYWKVLASACIFLGFL